MAKVSVLVLNFNGKHFLKECFDSLARQSFPDLDAWLVDNGSADGSVDYVRQMFPQVNVLPLHRNYGFSAAYNQAMKKIMTPYAVFLNNDTVTAENWLEQLIAAAEKNKAAVVGSKILSYERRDRVLSAGLMMTPAGVAYEMGLGEEDVPESIHNRSRPVGGVSGASMLVGTETFKRIGGFDEGYFAFCEDLDLCWRMNLLGQVVFYEPQSVVYHWSGGTAGGSDSRTRVYYMQKNILRTALKHFEILNFLKAFLVMLAYVFFKSCMYVVSGRFDLLRALWAASFEPLRGLKEILRQRAVMQKSRVISDQQLKAMGWICPLRAATREFFRTRRLLKIPLARNGK